MSSTSSNTPMTPVPEWSNLTQENPSEPSKRTATKRRLSKEEWAPHKEVIRMWYYEHKKKLREVQEKLNTERNFETSQSQLKHKLREWSKGDSGDGRHKNNTKNSTVTQPPSAISAAPHDRVPPATQQRVRDHRVARLRRPAALQQQGRGCRGRQSRTRADDEELYPDEDEAVGVLEYGPVPEGTYAALSAHHLASLDQLRQRTRSVSKGPGSISLDAGAATVSMYRHHSSTDFNEDDGAHYGSPLETRSLSLSSQSPEGLPLVQPNEQVFQFSHNSLPHHHHQTHGHPELEVDTSLNDTLSVDLTNTTFHPHSGGFSAGDYYGAHNYPYIDCAPDNSVFENFSEAVNRGQEQFQNNDMVGDDEIALYAGAFRRSRFLN